jgi:hypothetical protein
LASTASLLVVDGVSALTTLMVGDFITAASVAGTTLATAGKQSAADAFAAGEIMQVVKVTDAINVEVMRGTLGTVPTAIVDDAMVFKIPFESRNNNGKYSLAPISVTSFAAAQNRATQYHTFAETDRIISFCNPLQSDLNNAPGSAIMSAITDDALLANQIGAATQHPLAGGKAVFTNPLLMRGWVDSGGKDIDAGILTAETTTLTVDTDITTIIEIGDIITLDTGGVSHGEIMRVTAAAATSLTVIRGVFGTKATAFATDDNIRYMKKAEVSRLITQSQSGDNRYASSNGDASTAPSLWTVPRRHHLCRKLVTGAPELATPDVVADLYRVANSNNDMYAR